MRWFFTNTHAYNDTAPHAHCQADLRVPGVAIGFEPKVRMTGGHDHLEDITRQVQLGKCLLQTLGLRNASNNDKELRPRNCTTWPYCIQTKLKLDNFLLQKDFSLCITCCPKCFCPWIVHQCTHNLQIECEIFSPIGTQVYRTARNHCDPCKFWWFPLKCDISFKQESSATESNII